MKTRESDIKTSTPAEPDGCGSCPIGSGADWPEISGCLDKLARLRRYWVSAVWHAGIQHRNLPAPKPGGGGFLIFWTQRPPDVRRGMYGGTANREPPHESEAIAACGANSEIPRCRVEIAVRPHAREGMDGPDFLAIAPGHHLS